MLEVLRDVPVAEYAQRCGVDEDLVRAAARRIAAAESVAVFEDLGIQQAPHSTLCHTSRSCSGSSPATSPSLAASTCTPRSDPCSATGQGRTHAGHRRPCHRRAGAVQRDPDEILTDHPDRFRAMLVESGNPAHSLADSTACREALEALELVVVIDVAMTETARLADYVLPAASQYEKWEATFFNLEFPHNIFHLRHPLLEPLAGTLPEPEIWARLVRALGVVDDDELEPLRRAAAESREAFTQAFMQAVSTVPMMAKALPFVLYETLGPTLPEGLAGAAALWGLAQKAAMTYPEAVRRAGHADGNALFDAILAKPLRGDVHSTRVRGRLRADHPCRHKIALDMPQMLDGIRALATARPELTTPEFPIVLSAGERRAYTANDIFRDPAWRKRDTDGALRVSIEDAEALGLTDGGRALITTAAGSAEATVEVSEAMLPGHASLPNGFGLDYVDGGGRAYTTGVAPNSLTSTEWRDEYAATPWHKHVPARIEPQHKDSLARGAGFVVDVDDDAR